jgi:hypothetical protein
VSDAALRAVERAAPGTEAHAAALARAGRWVDAADAWAKVAPGTERHADALARAGRWVEAGDLFRLLATSADAERELALRRLRDAEAVMDLWAGAGPLARAESKTPIPTMRDLRALRAAHRRAGADRRRFQAAAAEAAAADVEGHAERRIDEAHARVCWGKRHPNDVDGCGERRRGEDGSRIRREGPCDAYRPFCSAPGYCWCGNFVTRHTDEAARAHCQRMGWETRALPTCSSCLAPITEGGVKDGDKHLCLRCGGVA